MQYHNAEYLGCHPHSHLISQSLEKVSGKLMFQNISKYLKNSIQNNKKYTAKYSKSYIISIAKTISKKIDALICFMKFLSPEFALYL